MKDSLENLSMDNFQKPIFYKLNSKNQKEKLTRHLSKACLINEAGLELESKILPNKLVENPTFVYFPWKNSIVKIPDKESFQKIRISRNRGLVSEADQKKIGSFRIAFAGLNVGNAAAICMALEGFQRMKFADNDTLSLSNLNRFNASLFDLGVNKAVLTSRQVYQINPFANLTVFSNGVTKKNIKRFLSSPNVDILVEEMDDLKVKIEIRKLAKAAKIPVAMVTGNGENLILDIERFDKEPKLEILNGRLKLEVIKKIKNLKRSEVSSKDYAQLCKEFMGEDLLVKELKESFPKVGKELQGIPQLAECSYLRGAVLCNVVRRIALNHDIRSGRYQVRLDSTFDYD